MSTTMQAIYTQTVGVGGGNVIFNNIPQTYTDLVVLVSGRGQESSTTNQMYMQANGVGIAGSYSSSSIFANGSSVAILKSFGATGDFLYLGNGTPNALASASTFGSTEIKIFNYTSGNYKTVAVDIVAENNATFANVSMSSGTILNTNPITSLLIGAFGGFAQNTTLTLYGISNVYDTQIPSAPSSVTATDLGGMASISFTANDSGAGASADHYSVSTSPSTAITYGQLSPIVATGLTPGQAYTFSVTSRNSLGSNQSTASSPLTTYNNFASIATGTGQNITFSNIPQNYKHLQLRIIARDPSATAEYPLYLQFNGDSGSGNYGYHYMSGDGATASTSAAITSQNSITLPKVTGNSATANYYGVAVIDIMEYSSLNRYKVIKGIGGNDRNGAGSVWFVSGYWNLALTSISTLSIGTASGNAMANSHFALYGIS